MKRTIEECVSEIRDRVDSIELRLPNKRELFAAMAMQGILTGLAPELNHLENLEDWGLEALAQMSSKCSDALMAELENKE